MTRPNGVPTEADVVALMTEHGSDEAAARAIGVSRQTFWRWRGKYRLEYRPVPAKAATYEEAA